MSAIDLTTPADDVLLSDIPSHIREVKALFSGTGIQSVIVYDAEVNLTSPDPVVTGGINIVNIFAPYAHAVANITGGADGNMMIFYAKDDNITFIHNVGTIELNGDPALPDFPMLAGDMLILIFRESVWKELYRSLA